MMELWKLPKSASIGGKEYTINTDYRDIFDIIEVLNDEKSPVSLRWEISLRLFYDGEIPNEYKYEAKEFLVNFLAYGSEDSNGKEKLIDWEIDASVIVGDINKVAGFDGKVDSIANS